MPAADRTIMLAYGHKRYCESPDSFRGRWMARIAAKLKAEGWGEAVMQPYKDEADNDNVTIGLPNAPGAPLCSFPWLLIEDAVDIDDMIVCAFQQSIKESNARN